MSKNGSMSEMERIQRGLEAFLQQELEGMQEQPQSREPQLFNIKDTNDESNSSKKDQQAENRINESDDLEKYDEQDDDMRGYEYHEDWDSKEHVAQMKTIKKQQKRAASQNTRETSKKKTEKTKKKRKKSKFKRFCMFLLVFLALLAGGMYYVVGKVYNKMEYEEIEALATAPMQEEGVVNILLIGNDSRSDGEDGRSDAMILLSVSKKTEKIYMTSLLRDMYVEIPGYKGNRLNAAYAYGGAELLMDTIEHNFDITVNRYVLVNFEAFANVVDAVGGIELELSSQEVEYVNAYLWEYNVLTNRPEGTDYMDTSVSGLVHLNGAQALSYTRNRYLGTDFGRTERQRKVLAQIIQKLPKAMVTNPKELINGLTTNLTTNLTQQECVQLCFWAVGALSYDMEQNSIPLEGTYTNATIRDMSVLEVDFETNKEFIRKNIYGEEE